MQASRLSAAIGTMNTQAEFSAIKAPLKVPQRTRDLTDGAVVLPPKNPGLPGTQQPNPTAIVSLEYLWVATILALGVIAGVSVIDAPPDKNETPPPPPPPPPPKP